MHYRLKITVIHSFTKPFYHIDVRQDEDDTTDKEQRYILVLDILTLPDRFSDTFPFIYLFIKFN